ncbi:metallophosphoesterase family protein [Psychroserpens ponticola]|uniref:Metallophosphoesterase n=1 Tax=Psychroserpens ponticola TaxID=2932268 RepID=A0ABY7S1W4_9FLAO|nr:metallophosphoesterase [Psychroserpens ponticola]WCO03169.1 metallophosphoesterase [Psychroserpens ponticola]
MKILHITDLHYTNQIGGRTKQKKLLDNFFNDLEKNIDKIDFVIFSGDLVQRGDKIEDFELAKVNFLEKIVAVTKISKENIFICPGNHDIDRSVVSKSLIKYLDEEIDDNIKLDDIFKQSNTDLINSHKPLENYRNFVNDYFKECTNSFDYVEEMYSTHIRNTSSGKIGFVCLNTAWRSVGINDDNNLLYPISKIDEALDRILSCDIKIVLHHHPLKDLRPWNLYKVEDLLHKRFDFMLSGHIHKNNLSLDLTPNDGVIKLGSSANLSFEVESQIGYSLINLDYIEDMFSVDFRMYDLKNEVFYPLDSKKYNIPTNEVLAKQNELRKNIRRRFLDELDDSKSLFVESDNKENRKDLLELSTNPVLKEKSISEVLNDDSSHPDYLWANFFKFEKDFIAYGKDKCGKTIMLKKIELELLRDFSIYNKIPFYIDLKYWSNSINDFNFFKELSKYYYTNANAAIKLFEEKDFILLLDNFHLEDNKTKDVLEKIVSENDNVRVIICSINSSLNSLDTARFDGRDLNKLYFHRLRKIHIKELTKRNYSFTEEKENQVVEKINTIFKKLSIPFNYWTISIFLWVFNKDANNKLHNDVDLINLYVEKLLEKEQLTVSASSFTFNNYKKLLAHFAYFLLKENHKNSYYAKYSDIIEFIQKYLDKNPRLRIDPRDIFDYLDSKSLLRKKDPDYYSFRLNGVFEYFVAYYMTFDQVFLNEAIEDENFYLSFSNEFELYAGFKRDNVEFLNKIYNKTKNHFFNLNQEYDLKITSIDTVLISKIVEADKLGKLIEKYSRKFQDSLSEIQQDEIEEQMNQEMKLDENHSEVKMKKINSLNESSNSLEESLTILGKVFRNTDDINDSDLVYKIFDYIIENACLWSFKLLDEFGEMDISEIIKTDSKGEAQGLLKLISNVIPTLVQVRLYDMLGHINLEGIIIERLEKSKTDYKNNQFKLFIYTFLLLDINYLQHKAIVEEMIPLIKIPIIKYSFLLKLNYYLGFKNNLSNTDKRELKNNIQSQYLKFNNKTDVGDIQKGIAHKIKNKKQ